MHAGSAWLMSGVRGEGGGLLAGLASHSEKTQQSTAFGEWMTRAAASAAPPAGPNVKVARNGGVQTAPVCQAEDDAATTKNIDAAVAESNAPARDHLLQLPVSGNAFVPAMAHPAERAANSPGTMPAVDSATVPDTGKAATKTAPKAAPNETKSAANRTVQARKSAISARVAGSNRHSASSPATTHANPAANPETEHASTETGPSHDAGDAHPSGASPTVGAGMGSFPAATGAEANAQKGTGPRQSSIAVPAAVITGAPIDRSGPAARASRVSIEFQNGDPGPALTTKSAASQAAKVSPQVLAEEVRAVGNTPASPASASPRSVLPMDQAAGAGRASVTGPAGAGAPIPCASSTTGTPTVSTSSPGAVSAAFTRMDAAAPPQVIESAPQRLSVGVRDSGFGWVEISTHAVAGQVSAVVAAGSNEAHAMLQAHLPELRDYLASQQVRVDQLTSERFSSTGGNRESAQREQNPGGSQSQEANRGDRMPQGTAHGEGAEESLSYINVRV